MKKLYEVNLEGYTYIIADSDKAAREFLIDNIREVLAGDCFEEPGSPWKLETHVINEIGSVDRSWKHGSPWGDNPKNRDMVDFFNLKDEYQEYLRLKEKFKEWDNDE